MKQSNTWLEMTVEKLANDHPGRETVITKLLPLIITGIDFVFDLKQSLC